MQMIKMDQFEFQKFYDRSLHEFAKQQSQDTGFSLGECLVKAKLVIDNHFSDGLSTPNQYLYHLKNESLEAVGYLWFGIRDQLNKKKVFIYDILIEKPFRGRGHSKIMLTWLETETKRLQIDEISLHVLGYNHTAKALYDSFGFEVTNIYMSKKI